MKSLTRDVLTLASGSRSSYSSGLLFVGDLVELAIDFQVTSVTSTLLFTVSREGTDSVLYQVGQTDEASSPRSLNLNIGAGLTVNPNVGTNQSAFGDYIQIDLEYGSGTFSASIKGK